MSTQATNVIIPPHTPPQPPSDTKRHENTQATYEIVSNHHQVFPHDTLTKVPRVPTIGSMVPSSPHITCDASESLMYYFVSFSKQHETTKYLFNINYLYYIYLTLVE